MEIDPETRGPLVSLLTQWHVGADEPTQGVDVTVPDVTAALSDLFLMFLTYVRDTERDYGDGDIRAIAAMAQMFVQYARETDQKHGSSFPEFLQGQALGAYDDPDKE